MKNVPDPGSDSEPADEATDTIRVKCTADSRSHDLEVTWTKGAIFEFDSHTDAERWLQDQNVHIPGRLFLSLAPENAEPLPVDYYVKYRAPDSQ